MQSLHTLANTRYTFSVPQLPGLYHVPRQHCSFFCVQLGMWMVHLFWSRLHVCRWSTTGWRVDGLDAPGDGVYDAMFETSSEEEGRQAWLREQIKHATARRSSRTMWQGVCSGVVSRCCRRPSGRTVFVRLWCVHRWVLQQAAAVCVLHHL